MEWLRQIAQGCLRRVDDLYNKRHRLQPAGEVLYVGRSRYRGPAMEFADGTRLAPGGFVGTLHFNNARFPRIEADTSRRAALRFMRLMLESMHILANKARKDPLFSDLARPTQVIFCRSVSPSTLLAALLALGQMQLTSRRT